MNKDWLMTDDDTYQHFFELDKKKFAAVEIIEYGSLGFRIRKGVIDMSNYYESVLDAIAALYYPSLRAIKTTGDRYYQIMAECIFESDSEFNGEFYDSIDEAKRAAEEYMKSFFTEEK